MNNYKWGDNVLLKDGNIGMIVETEANAILPYKVAINAENRSRWIAEDQILRSYEKSKYTKRMEKIVATQPALKEGEIF